MNSKVSRAGNAIRLSRGTRSKVRSEEHTSELQSLTNLVCRLLLEKKRAHSELQSLTNLVCRLLLEKKTEERGLEIHYHMRHESHWTLSSAITCRAITHASDVIIDSS